jgi:hypothetical protein
MNKYRHTIRPPGILIVLAVFAPHANAADIVNEGGWCLSDGGERDVVAKSGSDSPVQDISACGENAAVR